MAFVFAPTEDKSAVMQVPIFWPIIIGRTAEKGTVPVAQSACKIPMDAEELCMTAVSIVR